MWKILHKKKTYPTDLRVEFAAGEKTTGVARSGPGGTLKEGVGGGAAEEDPAELETVAGPSEVPELGDRVVTAGPENK